MPDVTIEAADGGRFGAYLAEPPGTARLPGILVIQEIFGVNAGIRALCDRFAADGHIAIAPDLFWRQEPGLQLSDQEPEGWSRGRALMQGFAETKGVDDLIATLAHLRAHPRSNGQAGTVGYCFGGRLAWRMATRSDADASVSYYGIGIENSLDEASAITRPVMLHIAAEDRLCPPEAQAKITEALSRLPTASVHIYPGVDHAFARIGGQNYDAAAAALADRRTAEFFRAHLA